MGVFKNVVGRPSNETIKKRNIFKGVCFVLVLTIILLVGYILNDKYDFLSENKKNSDVNNTTTTVTTTNKVNQAFNLDKITTKCVDNDCTGIYIYVYDKKLDIDIPFTNIVSKKSIDDIAIIDTGAIDSWILLIVNKNGEVLYNSEFQKDIPDLYYISDYEDLNEFYGYKIDGNKIRFTMGDVGQDVEYNLCNYGDNKVVYSEYEMIYDDGKLSKPKKVSSINAAQFRTSHKIDCSKIQ